MYRTSLGLRSDIIPYMKLDTLIAKSLNLPRIITYMWVMFIVSNNFLGIWILFFIALLFNIKNIYKAPYNLLMIGLLLWIALYLFTLIIVNVPLEWQLETASSRLVFHLIPVMIILVGLSIKDIWYRKKYNQTN